MLERVRRRRGRRGSTGHQPLRIHVGSGAERIEGWVNVDIQPFAGVDVVADVTEGFPFEGAEAIYAEHFLEHLRLDDAIEFLLNARRALRPNGWIRLSTPNLDWVWATHYAPGLPRDQKIEAALRTTRAFHGWGHRFLWNEELLAEALAACGFERIRSCRYGHSELAVFEGIERHRAHADTEGHQHVVIYEAAKGEADPRRLEDLRALVERELIRYLSG
jgi:predicted SAM-dependent methyltransferase